MRKRAFTFSLLATDCLFLLPVYSRLSTPPVPARIWTGLGRHRTENARADENHGLNPGPIPTVQSGLASVRALANPVTDVHSEQVEVVLERAEQHALALEKADPRQLVAT